MKTGTGVWAIVADHVRDSSPNELGFGMTDRRPFNESTTHPNITKIFARQRASSFEGNIPKFSKDYKAKELIIF